jgi:hypothetical protein
MAQKANVLANSKIPAEFNSKKIVQATKELTIESKKLDSMVKSKADDTKIKFASVKLHDTFHTIIGLCTEETH